MSKRVKQSIRQERLLRPGGKPEPRNDGNKKKIVTSAISITEGHKHGTIIKVKRKVIMLLIKK